MQKNLFVPFATAVLAQYINALNIEASVQEVGNPEEEQCKQILYSEKYRAKTQCETQECIDKVYEWLWPAMDKGCPDPEVQQCLNDAVETKKREYEQCHLKLTYGTPEAEACT